MTGSPYFLLVPATFSLQPLFIMAVAVAFIILAIVRFRIHAFLALVGASLLVAFLSADSLGDVLLNVKLVSVKFGETAGAIGLVIALAAIIGMCLTESGAADAIVNRFMKLFGEKRAGWALLTSGFLLSIPVFLDTVFFLLIPLAATLGRKTGKDYLLYLMALGGGAVITHSLVPPTPGPLLVGDILGLDLGPLIVAGALAGILPAASAYFIAKKLNKSAAIAVPVLLQPTTEPEETKRTLPPFWLALTPVLVPAVLIAAFSFLDMVEKDQIQKVVTHQYGAAGGGFDDPARRTAFYADVKAAQTSPENYSWLHGIMALLGEKVIALGIGALLAVALLFRQRKLSWKAFGHQTSGPLELAGVIILITSAGGAFGAMIGHTGIGSVISGVAENFDISYIFLAWFVTAAIRIAQGSGTVSMITGAGLMAAVLGSLEATGGSLAYHPVYIFMAIGFGSITCSWMNDSAFWILAKLSGMTEKETLKSWTPMLTLISVTGLLQTLLLSLILPLR